MLEHEYLQLGKLFEEIHALGSFDRPVVLITANRFFVVYGLCQEPPPYEGDGSTYIGPR